MIENIEIKKQELKSIRIPYLNLLSGISTPAFNEEGKKLGICQKQVQIQVELTIDI